jgi:hypothetical protein
MYCNGMDTKKSKQPKREKKRLNITLAPETIRKLSKASKTLNIPQGACIELALRDWFQKEGIK